MPATSRPPVRVLVADDSASIRELLVLLLNMESAFTVVGEAGDGIGAVALAQSLQPDLVILDVSMPRLDGIAALPRVRAVSPGSQVVLFTGENPHSIESEARAGGASAVITKDLGVMTLVDRLRALFWPWFPEPLPAAG